MIGDTVIYYPNGGDMVSALTREGTIEELAAIVIGEVGDLLHLTVFTQNPDHPLTQQFGIPHKNSKKTQQAYWDYKPNE